jgi:AraC-like DNA-binding protein
MPLDAPSVRVVRSLVAGGAEFQEIRVSEGASTPWHDHDSAYLDLYLGGAAKVSWQGERKVCSLSVIPPGMGHRSVTLTATHTFQAIVANPPPSLSHAVFGESRPRHIVQQMFHCFAVGDDLAGLELEEMLADFWVACGAVQAEAEGGGWLRTVEELLRGCWVNALSPAEIAREVGIHPAHLMREFRRVYRCTMGEFVRSVRVERACAVMRMGGVTLSEVAHGVGFADQSHFNRSFKRCMGVTPSEYLAAVGRPSERQESRT